MNGGTIHVIGAGLAGLSAATSLVGRGRRVVLHEAAAAAGGRCRSFADKATGLTIDNGNHLLLSGNRAALAYLRRIGAEDRLEGPAEAAFPFIDLESGLRWTLRPNSGRFPSWIFHAGRRVPDTSPADYLRVLGLLTKPAENPIGPRLTGAKALDERLWRPVLVSALNTAPEQSAAGLAARVIRETLAAGGSACRPLVAVNGLSATFVDPALRYLAAAGAEIRYSSRLEALSPGAGRLAGLRFGGESLVLGTEDVVVLAVPPWIAERLVPELVVPQDFRGILNLHYALPPPAGHPRLTGIVNATAQWLFAFDDRLSVTVSDADALLSEPPEALATRIWSEIARITGLPAESPAFRVVKEKRATFAATPAENARRPSTRTRFSNLFLAGDWTATGLPATIEGAVRSGDSAALALMRAGGADHVAAPKPIAGGIVAGG